MYNNNETPNKDKKKQGKLNLDLLPSSMKERYTAMGIIPKPQIPKAKIEVDIEKMKQKKIEKEQPIEKKLEGIEIKATETKALEKVFKMLVKDKIEKFDPQKEKQQSPFFDATDVDKMLRKLGVALTKSEVDLMLWEVDENLDGRVSWIEFLNMYKKCTLDKTGLEPKSLFHMIQFLMYYNPSRGNYKITVEDTLELLYVRFGRNLDSEIHAIFGDEEKTKDGQEKEITFSEYNQKINERAILQRKQRKEEQKQQFQYRKKEKSQFG